MRVSNNDQDMTGETADPDADAAWQSEIERQIEELDRGIVKPIPWSQARQMIFGDADDAERD
jgi:hypothetical protein